MALITGAAQTTGNDAVATERLRLQRVNEIMLEEPNQNPLTLVLKAGERMQTGGTKPEWLEDKAEDFLTRVNNAGGYNNSATSIVVDDGSLIGANWLVKVQRTGEVWHVTAVASNTLTVVRGWGSTAAAVNDNEHLIIMGPAAKDFSDYENVRMTKATNSFNYIQNFRTAFGASDNLINSDLYGGKYIPYQTKARGIVHNKQIEKTILFGERNIDSSGDQPRRSLGGIDEHIVTNEVDFGGTLTDEEMENMAEDGFLYSEANKLWLYCGFPVASNVSNLYKDRVRLRPSDNTVGLRAMVYNSTHGPINIVPHKLMRGDTYKNYGFLFDMKNLKIIHQQNMDTRIKPNVQSPGVDGEVHEWRSSLSIQRTHERKWVRGKRMAA